MALNELGPVGYAAVAIWVVSAFIVGAFVAYGVCVVSPPWLKRVLIAAFLIALLAWLYSMTGAFARSPRPEWFDPVTGKPQPFDGGFDGRGIHHKLDPKGPCWRWCGTCWVYGLPEWRRVC